MQNKPTNRMIVNRQVNDLAELAQEIILKLQSTTYSPVTTSRLAGAAKEALSRLTALTGGDYRLVMEDLERLVTNHAPRDLYWNETINDMERILQWLENAPMARRVV